MASAAERVGNPGSDALALPALLSQALDAAWRRGVLPEPTLQPAELIAAAERAERSALSPGCWSIALDRLTEEICRRDALSGLGKAMAHGQLVKVLRQRIRAQRLWAKRPQIATVRVRRPVIILGQMRSGTTRLHRMLAADKRFAFTRHHECLSPMAKSSVTAIASSAAVQGLLALCNPDLHRIHPSAPLSPEEEFGLHALSIHGAMFEAQWHVPDFARWSEGRDLVPVYADFRRLIQTLRWRQRVPDDRTQLMKAPQFMQDLQAVLAAFPDARILRMERDLDTTVASTASLVWHQQRIQSPLANRQQIAAEWSRKVALRERRANEALARRPDVPVLQVSFDGMNHDWQGELVRIYHFLGLDLPQSVTRSMAKVARDKAHQGHHYTADQFGLAGPSGV